MNQDSESKGFFRWIILFTLSAGAAVYYLLSKNPVSNNNPMPNINNFSFSDPEVSDYDGFDDDFLDSPSDSKMDIDTIIKEYKSTDPLTKETEVEMTEKFLNAAGEMLLLTRPFSQNLRSVNPFYLLGAYPYLDPVYFNSAPSGHPLYSYPNMGIINNPSYCEYVDLFNLYHPENIFDQMNFFTDYHPEGLVRKLVMTKMGHDTMPNISKNMEREKFLSKIYNLNHTTTLFYTKKVTFHYFHEIGKHFLCNSQVYSHIPGHGVLTRKDLQVESVKYQIIIYLIISKYAKRYKKRTHCFNNEMFFPYAYRLNDYEECVTFFKEINTEKYKIQKEKDKYVFIEKIGYGAHRGKGVFIFDDEREKMAKLKYADGQKCGDIAESTVMQKYIADPLLLEGHKFDFRIYMLIASVNPMILYYHDGFIRLSLHFYDKNSTERGVHLTNTHLSKEIFKLVSGSNQTFAGMNETELRNYQMWNNDELQEYLLQVGIINDTEWLDNYLRPQFQKAFIHLARMVEPYLFKHSGLFEMFGLDFILDDELNLWFIECNASPQLIGTSEEKTQFLTKMLHDIFEIEYAYLRSRMKRVHKFMKKFYQTLFTDSNFDLASLKEEFRDINKNYLEPEFQISENSSFTLIMDKNLKGKAAYFGLLSEECI